MAQDKKSEGTVTQGRKASLDPQGYFAHLLVQLKISAQLPLYSNFRWKNKVHTAYVVLIWTWVGLHFLTQIANVIVHKDDLLVVIKTMAFSILIFNQISRLLVIATRKEVALSIFQEMTAKFRRVSEDAGPNRVSIKNWERAGYLMYRMYWSCGIVCVPMLVMNPLLCRMYFGLPEPNSTEVISYDILPTNAWYPFRAESGPGYAVAYVFQAFPVLFIAYALGITDSCMYSVVLITCGQLHLLLHEIKYIRETAVSNVQAQMTSNRDIEECDVQQEITRLLKIYAKKHGEVLRFVGILEEVMSPCMLANSRVLTVCVVSTSFEILNSPVLTIPRLMGQAVYFCSALMQILAYCWNADELTKKQEEFHWHLYTSPWLEANLEYKKTMLLMAERARTPVLLTVGKIATLNKETYIAELNRAFSVFNAMLQLRDKK